MPSVSTIFLKRFDWDSEEKADGVSQSIRNHPKHAKYQLDIDCSMGDIEYTVSADSLFSLGIVIVK